MKGFLILLCSVTLILANDGPALPDLGNVPKSSNVDIRTLDDFVFYESRVIEITPQQLIFEYDGIQKVLQRSEIFRIVSGSSVYTDVSLTAEQNAALESARDYKAEYFDYVLRDDYTRFSGKITVFDKNHIEIEQDKVPNTISMQNVLAYRKDRQEKKITDRAIPPHWLRRLGAVQEARWHLTEGILGISSPLNLFPQVTVGLQTNSSWPIYAGVKGGASGNLITAGWYYAQGQFYLGINILQVGYVQSAVVVGYLYRNHFMNSPISCGCELGSQGYFNDFTTVDFNQKNYYTGIALKFQNVYLEVGWEFRDYFSASVTQPSIKNPPVSPENQAKIDKATTSAYSFASAVSAYSRFYFSIGYQLFML